MREQDICNIVGLAAVAAAFTIGAILIAWLAPSGSLVTLAVYLLGAGAGASAALGAAYAWLFSARAWASVMDE